MGIALHPVQNSDDIRDRYLHVDVEIGTYELDEILGGRLKVDHPADRRVGRERRWQVSEALNALAGRQGVVRELGDLRGRERGEAVDVGLCRLAVDRTRGSR